MQADPETKNYRLGWIVVAELFFGYFEMLVLVVLASFDLTFIEQALLAVFYFVQSPRSIAQSKTEKR
jgi:hypothetical protein